MSIGLGHPFLFNTTFNLVVQIITLGIIFLGLYFKMKNQFNKHGATMGIAVILHILTFLLVMGPIFFEFLDFFSTEINLNYVQTTWLHAIPGIITLISAIYLVSKWAIDTSNIKGCVGRKRIMDITIILWLFSLFFGIITYALIYVI